MKLCFTFLFTTRGIPQLYYGTEIGMEGYDDPDNRRDMPWNIFNSNISVKTSHPEEKDLFAYTRNLIKIRKEHKAISFGYLFTLFCDRLVYVYLREYRNDIVLVAINNGLEDMTLPLFILIGKNTNIPTRIKKNLEGKQLKNLLDNSDSMNYNNGKVAVLLKGKEGRIYSN